MTTTLQAADSGTPVERPGAVKEVASGFVFKTANLEATIIRGVITGLTDTRTGEVIADASLGDLDFPKGVGTLSGDIETMDRFHTPWGAVELDQHIELGTPMPNYWYPDERSAFNLTINGGRVTGTWTGLGNGSGFVDDATLTVEVWEDRNDGAMSFKASAYFPGGGLFGVLVPVANILPDAVFYLPHFGGMRFDRNIEPALRPYGGAPFYEAPVMALETPGGSVGLWTENVHNPYQVFFNWNGRSFSFSYQHKNLTPFEPHREIDSVVWKLDVFSGGGWMTAMRPFKDWYWDHFAREIAIRDSVEWAKDIMVVVDRFPQEQSVYQAVAETFDPGTVMFHFWDARAARFDRDLPDWTPREGYIETVADLKSLGFRTQAYVNTYCVNYNSPVFIRDNIADFFLTRKTRAGRYSSRPTGPQIEDAKIGDAQGGFGLTGGAQFEGVEEGRILYGDPLSRGWREYHANQMKWWNSTTGTDANYEDTAGTWGDYGNGVIDGKFAGQGAVAMMTELLEGQPHVPMATEYGPAPVAFGASWPLIYPQVWGNEQFKIYRLNKQHPIGSYLFGNRAWVPVIRAESDFLMHLVAANADALGGMGQLWAGRLDVDYGMTGHLKWRSQVFSEKRLTPYFEGKRYDKDLVSQYRSADGGIYSYYDGGKFQRMVGPDGEEQYGRSRGVAEVRTGMRIPGWPAYGDGKVFGLNPDGVSYAYFPGSSEDTDLVVTGLPEGAFVDSYREGEGFALLTLNGGEAVARGEVQLRLQGEYASLLVNGKPVAVPETGSLKLDLDFPVSILASNGGAAIPVGETIGSDATPTVLVDHSGMKALDVGFIGDQIQGRRADLLSIPMTRLQSLVGGEHMVDHLIRVPGDEKTSLQVRFGNTTSKYGDGTIFKVYLNGKLAMSHDCAKPNPDFRRGTLGIDGTVPRYLYDTNVYEWTIPLGAYAGKDVLVSVAVDPKASTNSDAQWYAQPVLVADEAQETRTRILEK